LSETGCGKEKQEANTYGKDVADLYIGVGFIRKVPRKGRKNE
jgi:hypothetical protein